MQKTKKIILAVLICALVGAGVLSAFLILGKKEVAPTGNKANVSWYTEDGKEFVISTVDELYGLVKLSEYYDFSGQTIKLGADIVVNEGNAEDWAEKAPSARWFPIDGFAGTFDGQGHTISGLYGYGVDTAMGLFSNTKMSCSIKDFKLLNSYFKVDGLYPVGSIVANGCGSLEKIYSDAIVTSNGENAGGIIGNANDDGTVSATAKASKITNCWFDGEVRMTTKTGRYGGGIVGRVFGGTLNISHCLNSGSISAESTESNGLYVGGIFGALTYTNFSGAVTLEDTLNVGKIDVQKATATGSIAGGTLANSSMIIKDTYTTEQSYTEVCSYQKSSTTGGVPMMNTDFIQGEEWYSWTTLNYDQYWTVTKDSTPILRCFADEVIDTSGLAKAYSFDWYNQYAQESIIDSVEDLYGFALMSYSETFQNKVVKLGADITVNEGKASQWASGKNIPDNCWLPIGRTPAFQGTFDGQGYTISGVYGTSAAPFMGLFGWIGNNSEVKNFSLTNSFFELTSTSASALGSIAGRLEGKIDTIYSDATINTVGVNVGGLVGYKLTDIESKATNCWYNGTINMIGDSAKNVGGVMGRLINGTMVVDNCLFSGKINVGGKLRTANTGGFIGNIAAGTVTVQNSLNSGEFILKDAEKMYAVGRVFGQVADSEAITITMENSYFTRKGLSEAYWYYCAGKKPTVIGGVELKEEKDILGYSGYRTTGLDFSKYWSVVVKEDGTPILKSFAKKSPSVAGLEKTFDKSWYSHDKTTYVLTDAKDLYGFLYLSNSKIDFTGKTIKLGNDIVVHAGSAAEWANGSNLPDKVYNWSGIGKHTNFQGTFDGQGHTISGLYGTADTSFMGLFGWVGTEGIVKNLRLTNSYLESTVKDSAAIGSIAGRLEGDIHTVYSDAIIKTYSALNGGIAGYKLTADTKSSITNSWYAGTMYMVGNDSKHSGGIVGRVIGGELELNSCLFTGKISIGGETRSANTGGLAGNINGTLIIKSCLNNGVFEVTEAEKMNSTCRVIGQVSNVDTANVTMENTYFTNIGDNGTWFWYNTGDKATIIGGAELKEEEDILGNDGYITTSLDFDNYWTIVVNADGAPILKSFASAVPSVAGLEKNFDTSWYDPDKDTYVLTDRKDLYGFVYLSNSNINFKGKTVTLGNTIRVNETGTADEWLAGTVPTYKWAPISEYGTFEGTFDGKGHTISGIYATEHAEFMGLFGRIGTSSVIKNLRLENSYFERDAEGGEFLGSVVGRADGDIHSVYSDAIIKSAKVLTGGIAGYKNTTSGTKITNSWYAGKMYLTSKYNGGLIGKTIGGALEIDNCLFSGEIHLSGISGNSRIGGFVGQATEDITITNCLNSGEFFNEDEAKLSGIGRVVGQNDDLITTEKVYIVNKGFSGSSLWYSPGNEKGTKPVIVQEPDILGEYGYYFTELDFEKYWTTVLDNETTTEDESGAPILQTFAAVVNPLPTAPSYADTSWYDESKKDYIIYDKHDLLGLAYLSKTGVTFEGKTITIADEDENGNPIDGIVVNAGTVAEWLEGTVTPEYNWEPIGKRYPFAGTFDGNGKTISGLYGVTETDYMGLFGQTAEGSTIKNLKIENSYFENSENYTGSIIGLCAGNLLNVYSEADVKGKVYTGGLIGQIFSESTEAISVDTCWFAGDIAVTDNQVGGIVGSINNGTVNMTNCLNTGTVDCGGANRAFIGGICGGMTAAAKGDVNVTMSKCLNVGELTNKGHDWVGAILGRKNGYSSFTATDVYGTNESHSKAIGNGSLASGKIEMVDASAITGILAFYNTDLDFVGTDEVDAAWVLVDGGTPILNYFKGDVTTLTAPTVPANASISWYDVTDAKYTLSNKEDLYGFAHMVNANLGFTFAGKTVELDRDITVNEGTVAEWKVDSFADLTKWTPIGTATTEFTGTFDGNYHSIIGLYINTSEVGGGLFRTTATGSTIQNLKLETCYINTTAGYAGSIVGSSSGNLVNVYSNAEINATNACVGGLVGQMYGEGTMNLEKCWFDGSVTSTKGTIGGIIGFVSKGIVNMTNCLNTGDVTGAVNSIGGLCARTFRSTERFAMNGTAVTTLGLHMTDCLNTGNIFSSVGWTGSVIGKIQHIMSGLTMSDVYTTKESYKDGDVAKPIGDGKTTDNSTANEVNLTDITVSATVSVDAVKDELGGLDFNIIWGIGSNKTPELAWVNNLNVDTSWYDESKNNYTISTQKQLYGVASLVESGVTFVGKTINLSQDITINQGTVAEWKTDGFAGLKGWTPIGTATTEFAGTFDGKGHSIKGLYVDWEEVGAGLFRSIASGSAIQNLKLENCYINTTAGYAGSIVGVCSGNLVNVHSDANINATSAVVGGIVGQMHSDGTMNLTQCQFTGTITNTKGTVGGIVGFVSKGIINMTNCLNKGTLTGAVNSIGGLIGRTFRSTTKFAMDDKAVTILGVTMENCLNTGNILSSVGWTGSIIGRIQHIQSGMNMTNVYATEESYKVSGTATTIGNGSVSSGSQKPKTVPKTNITVSGTVTADVIKSRLTEWGFDTNTIWTIGTAEGSTPELQMPSATTTTASLFTRVAMAIKDFITN